jgi:hypothetical protein
MGLLNLFSKPSPTVQLLPAGSMTLDRNACILATTISSAYDQELLQEIGENILRLFREARKAQMPLSEFTLHFASLRITARDLRGGAIVYLAPKHTFNASP